MEICAVTLKNFKTHADCHFEFRPGTNAICGENGAGKTSILEAIAWVLFDHSDYTRGELIRTGAKSTQVAVAFVSHLDERTYEARRCTSRGYELYDLQLNLNLGLHKLDDVQTWMREHLGVPPQTDLARLFAETIGIPQGTFTADFLRRPNDRKKIFDPILKVEAYRQTYDQLRNLETYARSQVAALSQKLEHYEQQLADWATLQQQHQRLEGVIAQDEASLAQFIREAAELQTTADQLNAAAQAVQSLSTQVQQLALQVASQTTALERLDAAWLSAKAAVDLCRAKRSSFQTYQAAQETLKQLADQRRQQQQILKQRDALQLQLRDREGETLQLQGQLSTFTELRQALTHWQSLVPQQEHLEQQLKQGLQALQALDPIKLQQQTLQTQYRQHQTQLEHLRAEIAKLEQGVAQVQQIPALEKERFQHQTRLTQIQAGQAFAGELQTLVGQAQGPCDHHQQQVAAAKLLLQQSFTDSPNLAFVQQVLESGLALNTKLLRSLQHRLQTLTDPAAITDLTEQLHHLTQTLQAAQTLQQQVAVLPLKQQQVIEMQQKLLHLQQQSETCDRQLAQAPALQAQVTQLEAELQQLNDPKGNLRLLQQQLQQAAKIQAQLTQLQTRLMPMQQDIAQLNAQIAAFAELDAQIEAQQTLLQTHDADYQQYLRHREQANTFRDIDPQRTTAQAGLTAIQAQTQQMQAQLQHAQQSYDPQQLSQLSTMLNQLQQQTDQLQGGLQPKRAQLQDLDQRLQARQAIATQQDCDRLLLGQKQQVLQFIVDARNIYNQSGPRITKYYLAEVSVTADKLFRELLNRDEVTLEWTEDYDIRVKERGYWRSFKSLSGGEQMCAALAVRLALLKVLADINVAFFDEPTTNMDQLRRQQLAEAINNLKAFRQLIVISHDDTFENVTDHVIRVERQPV